MDTKLTNRVLCAGLLFFLWACKKENGSDVQAPIPPEKKYPSVRTVPIPEIRLPLDSVFLQAYASDPDGSIVSYEWVNVSGPSLGQFADSTAAGTMVRNLKAGGYYFRVNVTDNDGLRSAGVVGVMVRPLPGTIDSSGAGDWDY